MKSITYEETSLGANFFEDEIPEDLMPKALEYRSRVVDGQTDAQPEQRNELSDAGLEGSRSDDLAGDIEDKNRGGGSSEQRQID